MMNRSSYLAMAFAAMTTYLMVDAYHVHRARELARHRLTTGDDLLKRLRVRIAVVMGRRRDIDRRRTKVLQALTALSSELQAGQSPHRAMENATDDSAIWPNAVAAARAHGDVAAGLTADARELAVLSHLAALWRLSARSGAGLADAVSRLTAAARREEDVRVQLQAHLAGPRATARVLSLLPVIGLGLGMLLGAQPLVWLVTTPIGWFCLGLGILLTAAGLFWTHRIARRVESQIS